MMETRSPEEKAATVLNGAMIAALSTAVAAGAVWGASDYIWRAVTQGAGFWKLEIAVRFLIPIGLVAGAVRGVMFGLRMMRSRPSG